MTPVCPAPISCAYAVFSHGLKWHAGKDVPNVDELGVVDDELSVSQHGLVPPSSYQHLLGSGFGGTYSGRGGGGGGGGGT